MTLRLLDLLGAIAVSALIIVLLVSLATWLSGVFAGFKQQEGGE